MSYSSFFLLPVMCVCVCVSLSVITTSHMPKHIASSTDIWTTYLWPHTKERVSCSYEISATNNSIASERIWNPFVDSWWNLYRDPQHCYFSYIWDLRFINICYINIVYICIILSYKCMSIKYVYLLSVTVLHSVKQVNHKTFFMKM